MKRQIAFVISFILVILTFGACNKSYTPKPRGYFRIEFPQKNYRQTFMALPFNFEQPTYSILSERNHDTQGQHWIDLHFKNYNANIHLSYAPVNNNLLKMMEESYDLAYEHSRKALSIDEELFVNPQSQTYGTLFNIKGNAASPLQFFLTDSTDHFLRGALYFNEVPNYDSLFPVIEFIKKDIEHLLYTMNWIENADN